MIVVYDKSFGGFLTLVYEYYYQKIRPKQIQTQPPQTLFDDEVYEVITCEQKSQKVLGALQKKFSKKYYENILNTFMCDNEDFEMMLLEYIVLGFSSISQLSNINNTSVLYIQRLQKKLFSNVHKMSGFLRFVELEDGTLYAIVENRCNIVYFLGRHFMKRLNNQNFIIHDRQRFLAFVKTNDFVGVQEVSTFDEPIHSSSEQKFQSLWKTFFESVSISSRTNEKLQRQMVPLLYRSYMTEFI